MPCICNVLFSVSLLADPFLWTVCLLLFSDYTFQDINTVIFLRSLDIIHAELLRNQNKTNKFIPVCLDHCSLDILPPMEVYLPIYSIPSNIDDLVIELLGKTRLQPTATWPILEFEHDDYKLAKEKLEQAVLKLKKNHPTSWSTILIGCGKIKSKTRITRLDSHNPLYSFCYFLIAIYFWKRLPAITCLGAVFIAVRVARSDTSPV